MKIALLHNHFDQKHLADTVAKMRVLGPPTIKVLGLDFGDMYQALEGCHRLRAAEILGVTPLIEEVNASDTLGDLGLTDSGDHDQTADEIGDYENYQIEIDYDTGLIIGMQGE